MRCSNSRLSCDPNQIIGIQFLNESHREGRVYVMKKRIVDGLEVRRSSGNVYADLGLPNAEKLKIKTGLVIEIRKAIRRLELTQGRSSAPVFFQNQERRRNRVVDGRW